MINKPNVLTVEEAIDRYCDSLDEYIQESYWGDGFCENRASDLLDAWASHDGLTIDWDTVERKQLWNVYQCAEKGLS